MNLSNAIHLHLNSSHHLVSRNQINVYLIQQIKIKEKYSFNLIYLNNYNKFD